MKELKVQPPVAMTQVPTQHVPASWWVVGAIVSLFLHGAAAAGLLIPWGRGDAVDTGGIVTVDIVAFSGPGAAASGPMAVASATLEDAARPQSGSAADGGRRAADAPPQPRTSNEARHAKAFAPTRSPPKALTHPAGQEADRASPASPPTPPESPPKAVQVSAQPDQAAPPLPARKPRPPARLVKRRGSMSGDPVQQPMPASLAQPAEGGGDAGGMFSDPLDTQRASLAAETGGSSGTGDASAAQAGGGTGAAPLSGNPQPGYPYRARQRQWEGRVVLLVLVDAEGRAKQVNVKSSSGYKILDTAAIDAVRQWRFDPARRGGHQVEEEVEVPVRFTLKDR